ncbi:TetR/AcrR family transcriptional regulator [Stenotrophomonas sp. CD2]|nr:TetR/AcrR family transcriptional regulator [Stenotrophomonas sp. CD2]
MTPKTAVAVPADAPAAAHAEAQRRRILDAAQKCFITRGFHAGSIGDIAAEAEISQGLMYRYFANKRALILALIERQLRHDQASISEMPAASDLVDGLLACYQQWARGEVLPIHGNAIASVALYAEINAEAHRDPVLAEVLRTHDKQTSAAIHAGCASVTSIWAGASTRKASPDAPCCCGCWWKAWPCVPCATPTCRRNGSAPCWPMRLVV